LLSLRTWDERHPNGAVETIHYDPADAQNISLVGADDEVRWQTTGGYLQGALIFAVAGVGLLLVGLRVRSAAQPS